MTCKDKPSLKNKLVWYLPKVYREVIYREQ